MSVLDDTGQQVIYINVSVWGPVHCVSFSVSILLYSISGVQNSVPEGPQYSSVSNLVICSSQIRCNLQICRPPGTEFDCPLLHFLLFSVSNMLYSVEDQFQQVVLCVGGFVTLVLLLILFSFSGMFCLY